MINFDIIYINKESLDIMKEIILPIITGFIGLIPFFYKELTEREKNRILKKERILTKLYDSMDNYYLFSISIFLCSKSDIIQKEDVINKIYDSRISFYKNLTIAERYLVNNELEIIRDLKEKLLNLDMEILSELNGSSKRKNTEIDVVELQNLWKKSQFIISKYL